MYSQIAANKRRSVFYTLGFVGIITGFGFLLTRVLGRPGFFIPIVIFAVGYAAFSYFGSAKLAVMSSGAQPLPKSEAPDLYRLIENLCITNGQPMPQVYLIQDPSPNAFATGRDPAHAVVAVTSGILELMDKDELQGVLAHELSHVKNYDIRFMAVVIALVSIISLLADFLLRFSFWGGIGRDEDEGSSNPILLVLGIAGAILAPIAASLLQLAVSRRREFLADASGALLTRYPDGLARALAKLEAYPRGLERASSGTAPLYISNPLKGHGGGLGGALAGLFSTHPPIADRIAALQAMDGRPLPAPDTATPDAAPPTNPAAL